MEEDRRNLSAHLPLRVNQLDAAETDDYIYSIFYGKLQDIFKHFKTDILSQYQPELTAAIKLLLWTFTLRRDGSTAGQKMLRMIYTDTSHQSNHTVLSSRQSTFYVVCTIFLPWLSERIVDLLRKFNASSVLLVQKVLSACNACLSILSFSNFLVFLVQGNYLHLVERLLGIRSMHPEARTLRDVGFDYSSREVLWHGFAEFIFFILPFINLGKWKKMIFRQNRSIQTANNLSSCFICEEAWPTNPHQMIGCKHVSCYHCAASALISDGVLRCKECDVNITSNRQLTSADLLVTESEALDS